ncbi:hypothetical protein L3X38_014281 [Prunus dulcis]|uniref:Uncharacterized protein n=1 Tax=Prunus dulcis TaxID=3755 RepID=A0AAD4ZGY6_PRUDU|nr:hypothetical protein L3X38_014281 [Prunus dulcis]
MSGEEGHTVGIDLGTTYSCVAVWQHDRVEIIVNDQGNRTTPSHVAFTDTETLIGDAAFNQVIRNPENSIFAVVRFAVYEGESTTTLNNYYLGDFRLKDIPPAPRGVPKFNICFEIDANGILNVSAEDMLTGQKKGITLSSNDTICEGIEKVML